MTSIALNMKSEKITETPFCVTGVFNLKDGFTKMTFRREQTVAENATVSVNKFDQMEIVDNKIENFDMVKWVKENYSKKDLPKLKKLATFLWATSASMLVAGVASAETGSGTDTTSLWNGMMPIFEMFQDIIMVLGAIALFSGLIIMLFKKQAGKKFLVTSAVIIGGCFVVPAAIMLIAIIGGMINDTLIDVFQNSNLRESVNVNGG